MVMLVYLVVKALFVCLFCRFTAMVMALYSYGDGGMVSSPNHTFSPGKA